MTAAELVAKQDRQLRIDAHMKADLAARRRDDRLQALSHKAAPARAPYGYVRTRRAKKVETTTQALHDLAGWCCVAFCLVLSLALIYK